MKTTFKVKIKKVNPNISLPKQATKLSGGWDVVASEIIQEEDDFVICKLGFAISLPEGYKLTLVPRSSLTKTRWIVQNSPGLGDADFTHEYQFRFRALPLPNQEPRITNEGHALLNYPEFPYKEGERIGQIYIEEVIPIEWEVVDELDKTERNGGWGSTGH